MALEALGHGLQLGAAPVAGLAAKRPGEIFVIGTDDEGARAALGTHQLAGGLEIAHQADVGAGEVVDEPIIAVVGRAAARAAAAISGQPLAARADLQPVPQHGR